MNNTLGCMIEALDAIQRHTSEEVNGNPVISKYSQEMVRTATKVMHKNLALITFKIGLLEQEKISLEHRLHLSTLRMPNVSSTRLHQMNTKNLSRQNKNLCSRNTEW